MNSKIYSKIQNSKIHSKREHYFNLFVDDYFRRPFPLILVLPTLFLVSELSNKYSTKKKTWLSTAHSRSIVFELRTITDVALNEE